jgi:hypothetical protein
MLFNHATTLISCIIISACAFSQTKELKVKFGDIKPEDFKPTAYSVDSSADAVYLYDFGSCKYQGNTQGWFSIVFNVHERIRLLHKKSFDDLATVKIPFPQDEAKVNDLKAATYNLKDGNVVVSAIDKKSFFTDKDGDYKIIKFTYPDLQEGSIIEYTFTMTVPVYYKHEFIPDWSFQGDYPYLWSEYTVEVPQFFDFIQLRQGYLAPAIDTTTASADNFHILFSNGAEASQTVNIRSNTIMHTWAYKDVPALKDESFITSLKNYRERIQFQLAAHRFPDEQPEFFMHTWPETVDQLMKADYFGEDVTKENGWLKDDIKNAVKDETDPLKKAKSIYESIRDNYTCTDYSAVFLSQSIKKTNQLKKGNVADINMLLIAALRNAGFDANPVLLSTREHGKTYDMYPLLDKFNYVIAQVTINDKPYLLDAADALVGFGHLDEDCYNGNARLIASTPFLIDLSADSLHESEMTSLFLSNGDNGEITGSYKSVMGQMQSIGLREKIKKSSQDDYFKDVKKSFSFDVNLSNEAIDSLKQPDMPAQVHYDISFKPEDDILYFNPMFPADAYKENPFKSAQRFYPVEMPYCIDETYVLNMEIPKGYKVDELPKSARVSLNGNEGMFEYLIQQSNDLIQMRCRTKLNKANFEPEDYETLRNFFSFIVEKESEQIVFKKQ